MPDGTFETVAPPAPQSPDTRTEIVVPGTGRMQVRTELAQHVSGLEQAVEHYKQLAAERATERESDLSDLGIISEALRAEAIERDWCSDYADFVDKVNGLTAGDWLQKCEQEYRVTFTIIAPTDRLDELEGAIDDGLGSNDFHESANFTWKVVD